MKVNRQLSGGSSATVLAWLVLACFLLGAAFYLLRKKQPEVVPVVMIATPEPATPVPATPAPVVVKATPTPEPIVIATPTPKPVVVATPPPLDLALVARAPSLWPQQVLLIEATSIPVSFNGRVVGEAKLPVGTALRLLRVIGQQVEVEYQSNRHWVMASKTDLMPRALATFRAAGSTIPETPTQAAAVIQNDAGATPPPRAPVVGAAKIGDRIAIEVVRQKKSRIEGGDFDDKLDRIILKVKLNNTDTSLSAEGLKGDICIFGESILDARAIKLLGKQEFTFSLPPRGSHELMTEEVSTAYDTTGARFGHRYEGWVLRIRDGSGNLVLEKSNSPSLAKIASKVFDVGVNSEIDRNTAAVKAPSRR